MEEYKQRGYLREEFRLFHLRDSRGTRTDFHYHTFHKVLLLVSGSGSYVVGGARFLLQPGDAVLVGSGVVHRPQFAPDSPYERIIIYISPDFLARFSEPGCDLADCFRAERGPVLRPGEAGQAALHIIASALEQELASERYGAAVLARQHLIALLIEISRQQRMTAPAAPAPLASGSGRMLEILAYLDAHAAEDLSIDDLARQFYLSKYHMMRLFRRETGMTIHTYLTDRRLAMARDYIRRGYRATDACFRSGFRSYCTFTRAYARRFGTTPTGRPEALLAPDDLLE